MQGRCHCRLSGSALARASLTRSALTPASAPEPPGIKCKKPHCWCALLLRLQPLHPEIKYKKPHVPCTLGVLSTLCCLLYTSPSPRDRG
eukprot:2546561-Rhodomonas_salina.1